MQSLSSNIIKTKDYDEAIKKLKIENEDIFNKSINAFVKLEEDNKYSIIKDSYCRIFKNNDFQLWKIRLPNPFANKGKSGGCRLLLVLEYENKTWYLHKIFQKTDNSEKDIQNEIKLLKQEYIR